MAAARLTCDAWRSGEDGDLRRRNAMLEACDDHELRTAARSLAVLVVGLGAVLEESRDDFDFDAWLAEHALDVAAKDAAG